MVHFPEFAHTRLWIHRAVRRFYLRGFPHSDIPGSKPACGSPRLIAACHVLHRLLAPRHPPYALSSLTIKLTQHVVGPVSRFLEQRVKKQCRASSPFHNLLCSSRICRFHTTSKIRANLSRDTKCQPIQLSKNFVSGPAGPPRSWRDVRSPFFSKRGRNNKKPGVERRAKPSATIRTGSRDARLFCYPEFVTDLTSGGLPGSERKSER